MTSLLGKLKCVVVLIILGYSAFAKANSSKPYYHTTDLTSIKQTYTLDRFMDRDELFELFKTLTSNHQISAKLTAYKRGAGLITTLGIEFTSATGVVTNVYQEHPDGIKKLCITVDKATKEITSAQSCEPAVKSTQATVKSAQQERLVAVRERIATTQEIATLRLEQQRESNRIAIEARKNAMAAKLEASRMRTDSIMQFASQAREEQRLVIAQRALERKEELEQARLAKIDQDKIAIEEQTAALALKAQQEREELQRLEEEKARVSEQGLKQQAAIIAARDAAKQAKDSLLKLERNSKRQRLTMERARLEKAQSEITRVLNEKNALEKLKTKQEEKLKQLELATNKSKEIIALRKEQNDLKAKLTLLEIERQQAEAVLAAPLNDEHFLYEGFLYFNADQCYYKVVEGATYVFDNLGSLLFMLDSELEKGDAVGTLTIKNETYNYLLKNNVLTVTSKDGKPVNEHGAVQTVARIINNREESLRPFEVTTAFKINAKTTQTDIDKLAESLDSLGHQFQLYDFERSASGMLKKVVFFIDENNYTFQNPDGITSIVIQYDANHNTVRVRAASPF